MSKYPAHYPIPVYFSVPKKPVRSRMLDSLESLFTAFADLAWGYPLLALYWLI